MQIVWNFVIECYRSTRLCLRFDPRTIGIACYEMTCTHLKREVSFFAHQLPSPMALGKHDWESHAWHGGHVSFGECKARRKSCMPLPQNILPSNNLSKVLRDVKEPD